MADPIRSERARRGWETRRLRYMGKCSVCGKAAKLYALDPIHPIRDLCIDCGQKLSEANRG